MKKFYDCPARITMHAGGSRSLHMHYIYTIYTLFVCFVVVGLFDCLFGCLCFFCFFSRDNNMIFIDTVEFRYYVVIIILVNVGT